MITEGAYRFANTFHILYALRFNTYVNESLKNEDEEKWRDQRSFFATDTSF